MRTVNVACLCRRWLLCVLMSLALWGLTAQRTAAAPVTLDPARSLFVTDSAVLDSGTGRLFSLKRVFNQLVAQSRVPNLTRQRLWQQWWDTLRSSPGLGLGANCDNSLTPDGQPGINGFPIDCPRQEGDEADVSPFERTGAVFYKTTALVNRFDLTPVSGAHCGEYRMVFARTSRSFGGRNFLIFEAVLPNPTPALGLEGCRPVAQFWAKLSSIANSNVRANELARFYFTGLPGFAPVVTIDHYITGQIRTNMFIEPLWQLREFKLMHRCSTPVNPCSALRIEPVTDKSTPFGALFDDMSTHPKAVTFRTHFLRRIPDLLADNLMGIALQNANRFNAGQSSAQGVENDYAFHFANGRGSFAQAVQQKLHALGSDLTPTHIVNRAMTQSCAGCHEVSTFGANSDLGHSLVWPPSLGFVHVDEAGSISEALRTVFLPHRQAVLEAFLNRTILRAVATLSATPEAADALTIGGPLRTH